jgi:hypothetical protein
MLLHRSTPAYPAGLLPSCMIPTLRPIVHAHRAGRTGFHHPDCCSVASGRKNSADLCRLAHLTRRSIFPGRAGGANFTCDISRRPPGAPVSTASPSLAIVLNRRPRCLDSPPHTMERQLRAGVSLFLFLTVARYRVRSVPRHAPTRARTGREGRASGYYRPSRSGHLWCGHHRRGYAPHPARPGVIPLDPLGSPISAADQWHENCPFPW